MSDVSRPRSQTGDSVRGFAAKARDLESLRKAVDDAATVSGPLWISYLFALFYLLVAAGAVTHVDLFLERPVKLPFLGIELPLLGLFWLAPIIFVMLHAYVLLHFVILTRKVTAFSTALRERVASWDTRQRLREQLPTNVFVQLLAGPDAVRQGAVGLLLWLLAVASLIAGPVLLLLFMILQFLPYHSEWVSWVQRISLCLDVVLLWVLWPRLGTGDGRAAAAPVVGRAVRFAFGVSPLEGPLRPMLTWAFGVAPRVALPAPGLVIGAAFSTAAALLVFTVATFPGEQLDDWLKPYKSDGSRLARVRKVLVEGKVNEESNRPMSWFANRLVLPGFDINEHPRFDTKEKLEHARITLHLRHRDLRNAVLTGAELPKVELDHAHMEGASLDGAHLQGAALIGAHLQGASLNGAHLQGASLVGAQLQGAALSDAHLRGGLVDFANLQGSARRNARLQRASLDFAQLQGASLDDAELQGASRRHAHLQGASLDFAQLQGASLDDAELQGASLYFAQLQGASLDGAHLQGASLDFAQLQGASLFDADPEFAYVAQIYVWRTDVQGEQWNAEVHLALTGPVQQDPQDPVFQYVPFDRAAYDALRKEVADAIPGEYARAAALRRLERLDPKPDPDGDRQREEVWTMLATRPAPKVKNPVPGLAALGCGAEAPYVVRGLIRNILSPTALLTGPERRDLAREFLKPACAGAKGLDADDLALLSEAANPP